jgi:transcription elongation factor SPT6
LDQAPYRSKSLSNGEVPQVFAFSNGKGERGRDAIIGIFINGNGRVLEHLKIDDLKDEGKRQKLFEKLNKR